MLQSIKSRFSRPRLTKSLLDQWHTQGFLVLESFFRPENLVRFEGETRDIVDNRTDRAGDVTIDVLAGPLVGQRMRLADATDQALEYPHKINDLYLESQACRELALGRELCRVLSALIGGKPMIINSLTFTRGSQQPHHFDTYYMPPPVQNRMVVSSICLEDQSETTGPLSYYPGSHRIPPYRFSHGGIHAVESEIEAATAYIQEQIDRLGLERRTFIGRAGDVFIWHGQLYHGGLPIRDHNRTRKTLVTHYWRATDVPQQRVGKAGNSGAYLIREHQRGQPHGVE